MKINEIKSEKFLNNPYGVIVPFSVTGRTDGTYECDVYDVLRDKVELTAPADYLTEGFFRRVNLSLAHPVAALGYEPDMQLTHSFLMHYRSDKILDESAILPSTVKVEDIAAYTDLTDTEFSTDEFPVFATLEGGALVCTCGVNDFIDENTVEIAVETVEKYRGNGYARSCVTAMVNYLISEGYSAAYLTYPDNTASIALAESCALDLYSRDYHFVCYEKEE